MKGYLIGLLILFPLTNLFGQINYLDVRNQFTISCGKVDSVELVRNQSFLDSLSQLQIIEGEEKFLYDIGFTYYRLYLKWKRKDDIIKSTDFNQKCWNKYQNYMALWNLGQNYGILENCDKKLELTELYISHMKKNNLDQFIDYEQIYYRYKNCREN